MTARITAGPVGVRALMPAAAPPGPLVLAAARQAVDTYATDEQDRAELLAMLGLDGQDDAVRWPRTDPTITRRMP